ncbi:MAG TPA: MaoC family dehydratase [Gemmataceae bacterium]|jgi:acyl dehydratase|nr:MaoC family dehydratase [Gemmataceae bacterium]
MPLRIVNDLAELKTLIGQEVGTSDWFEVSQSLINAFAEVTRDRQWIHIDPERARKESPYGTTIAHGFLTLSLLTHLLSQAFQVRGGFQKAINYGLNRVRFPAPVPAGSRIRAHGVLQAVEDIPDGVQVTWQVTVKCEGNPKPVLVAEWIGRWYH